MEDEKKKRERNGCRVGLKEVVNTSSVKHKWVVNMGFEM